MQQARRMPRTLLDSASTTPFFSFLPPMTLARNPIRFTAWLAAMLATVCVGAAWGVGNGHLDNAPASSAMSVDNNRTWDALPLRQRVALQPLSEHWASMDDARREKWLAVADRYWSLSPTEQKRSQARMSQWAHLPSRERGEARLRYQQFQQLSPSERKAKWDAYQALPEDEKRRLARMAQRQAKPVILPDNVAGPREAQQAFGGKRALMAPNTANKRSALPNTPGPAPEAVAPTLIKAGAGATTHLVNQRLQAPKFQHMGQPRVAATKNLVDPVTLLPKKGAQGAAMSHMTSASGANPDAASSKRQAIP